MPSKRPPVDKRSISKQDFDRLPKFQEGGFAVLNRILPSEQKKIEETAKYYDTYNDLVEQYNKALADYEAQYGQAAASHNTAVNRYQADYDATVSAYNKALADYEAQVAGFNRNQVEPYNAALSKYQSDYAAYLNQVNAYNEQLAKAQQAYEAQYGDYEKQYNAYLNQFKDYETQFSQYQPQIQAAQSQLDAYQRPYADQLQQLEDSTYYYNQLYYGDYSKFMGRADEYASRAKMMREDPWMMMFEGQFGRTPEMYDAWAADSRSKAEVLIPDINRAAEQVEQADNNLRSAGFSFDQYNDLVNNVNRVVQQGPREPTFNIQAPVLNIQPFNQQEPMFTQQAPVFTGQQPTFQFDRQAPVFNFNVPEPQRPAAPEMNPEQLQAYQERAQKMAGYRASGLEKAFEMGMLPEIAQYFKRGVM